MRIRLLTFSTLFAATAGAQGLEVQAVGISASHRLLGDPLVGVGATMRVTGASRLGFRLGAEYSRSNTNSMRSPCSGMVMPGEDCSPRAMRDRGRLMLISGGVEARLLARGPFAFEAFGDISAGSLELETRRETAQSGTPASKAMLGVMAGGALRWSVTDKWTVRGSASGGWLQPTMPEELIDAVSPFEAGFATRGVGLGLIWTPRRW